VRTAWLIVLAACGRVKFDPLYDAGTGSDSDATTDAGTCWPAWRDHSVRLTTPQPIAATVTTANELDPVIAGEDLTLYFARGPSTARDIFMSTRPDRSSSFEAPIVRPDMSSAGEDGKLAMPADELSFVISVDRTVAAEFDLWQLSRATTAETFASPTTSPFAQVNTAQNERDPHLSRDGLTLYFAATTMQGQEIRVASRQTTTVPFDASAPVAGLSALVTADPAVSPDGLVIVYTGAPVSMMNNQLNYATRMSPTGPFANAQQVPDIMASSAADDGDGQLSRDGCELFFSSNRSGNRDLYYARVQ
jgi:hypothetical protein